MKTHYLRSARSFLRQRSNLAKCRWLYRTKAKHECPICGYHGPFLDVNPETGLRKHARCPSCGSLERHRLQYLVAQSVLEHLDPSRQRMLHFAPEPFLKQWFQGLFAKYETADLNMDHVDVRVDIQRLPFANSIYDFAFASHVLEHIHDDLAATREISRVLNTEGVAIHPVPIVCDETVEYPERSPHESGHVRAPRYDYFYRYERHFARVERYSSDMFPEKYQVFVYEDRTRFPSDRAPLRPAMAGERHIDIVPVCYASGRQPPPQSPTP